MTFNVSWEASRPVIILQLIYLRRAPWYLGTNNFIMQTKLKNPRPIINMLNNQFKVTELNKQSTIYVHWLYRYSFLKNKNITNFSSNSCPIYMQNWEWSTYDNLNIVIRVFILPPQYPCTSTTATRGNSFFDLEYMNLRFFWWEKIRVEDLGIKISSSNLNLPINSLCMCWCTNVNILFTWLSLVCNKSVKKIYIFSVSSN